MSIKEATASQSQPHTAFRHSTDPVPRATDLGPYADFILACEPRTYFRSKRPPEIRLRFVGLLFLARHAILLRQERVTRPLERLRGRLSLTRRNLQTINRKIKISLLFIKKSILLAEPFFPLFDFSSSLKKKANIKQALLPGWSKIVPLRVQCFPLTFRA